ncbi:MAG: spoIIIJ-associated protein [Pseudonocardiales bacterium]|nr:spoIIIJ-associated protein [Pseudonocardiales bacterium]
MTDTDTDTTLPTNQAGPDDDAADGVDRQPATDGPGHHSTDEPAADTETDELDADPDDGENGDGKRGGSLLVREGDIAADYLERLLDIVDYDGDIDLDVENGRAMVAIVGSDLQPLIGQQGATLDALQELTRLAVQQQTGVRSRLMLDVSGYRRARRDELTILAQQTAEQVVSTGEPVRLSAMNPFERKVVHDAIAALDGVVSESEGEEPSRRVVVLPAP